MLSDEEIVKLVFPDKGVSRNVGDLVVQAFRLGEARSGMFTELVNAIQEDIRKIDETYPNHSNVLGKVSFRVKMLADELEEQYKKEREHGEA